MKRFTPILLILLLAACGGDAPLARPTRPATAVPPTSVPTNVTEATAVPAPTHTTAAPPQFGLNFIRFYWGPNDNPTADFVQPDAIFNDFQALGVQAFRQFIKADLFWNIVEPEDNQWQFEQADNVIMHAPIAPIVTLFSLQYASPTPPWGREFQKTVGPEATDYITTVVQRYAPYVTYWEIGNEMDHWRAFDPGDNDMPPPRSQLSAVPANGFSPQEQGVFLAQVAELIRANDPDAVILMPGMGGLDNYTLNTWFAGVVEGGGADWFDVVNYHFYSSWERLPFLHKDLDAFLAAHGIADKPVWLTETGATNDPTLNGRTDYPNSPQTQAADVFRRALLAYGAGDSYVGWHTYIGSPSAPDNLWRGYGIRTDSGENELAYYAVQLLTTELVPFTAVTPIATIQEQQVFRVETAVGETKYVAWGQGSFTVPEGMAQMASVVPDETGGITWLEVTPGETITLTEYPVLLK